MKFLSEVDITYKNIPSTILLNTLSQIFDTPLSKTKDRLLLTYSLINTPLGAMIAIADKDNLYLLEFVERCGLEQEIIRLKMKTGGAIIRGKSDPLVSIEKEISQYFQEGKKTFKTPYRIISTSFQEVVWKELCLIPPGETRSYLDIAKAIGKPTGSRAVARANSTNQLAIVIPCHRVICSNGKISGYAGGVHRKQWMLKHESK